MSMTVSYLTIQGEILSETRSGAQSDYIPDPVGSTAALTNSSLAISDSFSWWPYGELRAHTGTSATPFGYVGTLGYYGNLQRTGIYIRRRILEPVVTSWQTADPNWPAQPAYQYAVASPETFVDRTGMGAEPAGVKKCPVGWKLVKVTCYGHADAAHPRSDSDAAYACNKKCGGKRRKGRVGDCAIDQKPGKGHGTVCGPGQTVSIASPGPGPRPVKITCTVCDSGQDHGGIDVFVDAPDSKCDHYFDGGWYCVKCS